MKATRKMTVDTKMFEIGDIIKFKLKNGEKVKATAVREVAEGMLFITVDCVGGGQPMFKDLNAIDGEKFSYLNSDLRQYLNNELFPLFPKKIRKRMVGMRIGNGTDFDLLRIPTEKEIFGKNVYGKDEGKVKRFKGMKKLRNHIAFDHSHGGEDWECFWLQNRHKEYASNFAECYYTGSVYYYLASYSLGVRPVFCLA